MARLSRAIRAIDFVPTDGAGATHEFSVWGGKASTGEQITPEVALNVSAYWRGLNLLSNSIAVLPLKVYQRVGENDKRTAREHPSWLLLHDRPNPEMSSFTFKQTLGGHVVGWGNGYAEIERDGFNQPINLWPLRPDRMTPERETLTADQLRAGRRPRRRWKYLLPDGSVQYFGPKEILHLKGLGYDGSVGYPVLTLMRNTIGMIRALETYGATTFKNGARPSVVLTHPQRLSEKARQELAQDWTEKYGGLNNAQRVAVLEEGIKVETIGFPPEDAQFLGSRQFQVLEFARWLGLPPHKLYDLDRATFSNIEQQALEYLTDSVNPWLVNWEEQIQLAIFPELSEFYAEFDRNALLQVDARSRAFYYQTLRWLGVVNASYIASRENLPVPAEGGDDYYVPMNMQQVGAAPITRAAPAGPGPSGEEESALSWQLYELSERIEALEQRNGNGSHVK